MLFGFSALDPDGHLRTGRDVAEKDGVHLDAAGHGQRFVGIAAGEHRGGQVLEGQHGGAVGQVAAQSAVIVHLADGDAGETASHVHGRELLDRKLESEGAVGLAGEGGFAGGVHGTVGHRLLVPGLPPEPDAHRHLDGGGTGTDRQHQEQQQRDEDRPGASAHMLQRNRHIQESTFPAAEAALCVPKRNAKEFVTAKITYSEEKVNLACEAFTKMFHIRHILWKKRRRLCRRHKKAASRRTGSGRSQENLDLKVRVVLQHVDAGHEGALLGVLERSLLDVLVQGDSSAGGVGDGAGAADAAAGAAHAFQQVAVVLTGLGQHQQLLALGEALCGRDLDVHIGMPLLDLVGDSLGDAAGLCEAAACAGSVDQIDLIGIDFEVGHIDVLGLDDAGQFLEGQHEVHIRADGAAGSFQLLGGAGSDEAHTGLRVGLLHHAGGKDHGGHGHGDVLCKIREGGLCHHAPCRAAGSSHEVQLVGDLLQEVVGLIHGTQVGTDGDLHDVVEAQSLQRSLELAGGGQARELVDEGGSDEGVDAVTAVEALNELVDLALVGDGTEGAVDQTLAAGHALAVVDLGAAQLIGVDGTHAAGSGAGTLGLDDGVVGADADAAAALDALFLVDGGTAALPGDGLLGADFHTGVCEAALAQVGDLDQLLGAAVAGKLDDVHQRGVIILIGDGSVLQTGDDAVVLVHAAGGQAHGQTNALLDDGALEEDVLAELAFLTGDDGVRDLAHQVVGLLALDVGVGHPCYLGKDLAADLDDRRVDSSETHSNLSLL